MLLRRVVAEGWQSLRGYGRRHSTAVGTFRTKGSIDISEADEQQMQIRGYGDSSFQLVNQSLRVFRKSFLFAVEKLWLFVINIISRCDVSGLFPFFPPY